MSKKEKKVFKKPSTLAPRLTINRRWTNWRQQFHRNLEAYNLGYPHLIINKSLAQTSDLAPMSNLLTQFSSSINPRSSTSSLKSSCLFVGRSRGFSRDWGVSRHTLRHLARANAIPGLTKERF